MYTSQESGDILVRMCGSCEKIMVDKGRSRRNLKQVKQCIMPFYAFCASQTTYGFFKCSNACRHVQLDVH